MGSTVLEAGTLPGLSVLPVRHVNEPAPPWSCGTLEASAEDRHGAAGHPPSILWMRHHRVQRGTKGLWTQKDFAELQETPSGAWPRAVEGAAWVLPKAHPKTRTGEEVV